MADGGLSLEMVWARVRGRMRTECGESEFRSWLKPLELIETHPRGMVLAVPSRFMRDWVATHFLDRIGQHCRDEAGYPVSVEVVARPTPRPSVKTEDAGEAAEHDAISGAATDAAPNGTANGAVAAVRRPAAREAVNGEPMGASLDPGCRFETFVVGKPNEFAYAAARRVAEAEQVPFNPLFLYGGVGLGKTHLMHAIAWEMRARFPQRKVLYMSAEYFMYRFIAALRHRDTVEFKQQLRTADVLMIDDVQFISGKDSTQEEFFHTFNALADENRQIVLSADKSPADLDGMEVRLKSRLGWGVVADIHPTDYELRLGILQARAERLNFSVSEKVLEFIAHRITGNVRELEGALNRLDAHASLIGREITLDVVPELLRDLLRANDRKVSIEEIQRKVAEHYNVKYADMMSARRARQVARPRQVAMYLAKQLTQRSLPEIGRKFGGRDHTTVMHAVRRVEELCLVDASFADDVERLRRILEGS
ncbi:MAG: chromosomal replication initiator protein DnaA [Alphaproteobacteria bacterium]